MAGNKRNEGRALPRTVPSCPPAAERFCTTLPLLVRRRLAGLRHPGIRSLHSPGRIRGSRRRRSDHQAQALQQHDRALCRCPPDELATFSLAVLHVDVSPGIFQAAILKSAVDENSLIQDQVLIFEYYVFVSGHEKSRLPPVGCGCKPGLNRGSSCFRVDRTRATAATADGPDMDRHRPAGQSHSLLSRRHAGRANHLHLEFPR